MLTSFALRLAIFHFSLQSVLRPALKTLVDQGRIRRSRPTPGSGRYHDSYDRPYMPWWESIGGKAKVGTAVVDEKGRVLIPLEDRTRAGLKPGVELEISQQKQGLLLRPVTPKPIRVRASRAKWGKEAFPDAGEATFGG